MYTYKCTQTYMCTHTFVYIYKNTFLGSHHCLSKRNLCSFNKLIELKTFRSEHLSRHSDLYISTFQHLHFYLSIQMYTLKKYFHEVGHSSVAQHLLSLCQSLGSIPVGKKNVSLNTLWNFICIIKSTKL
jgi:hypothetical protein